MICSPLLFLPDKHTGASVLWSACGSTDFFDVCVPCTFPVRLDIRWWVSLLKLPNRKSRLLASYVCAGTVTGFKNFTRPEMSSSSQPPALGQPQLTQSSNPGLLTLSLYYAIFNSIQFSYCYSQKTSKDSKLVFTLKPNITEGCKYSRLSDR